MAAQVALEKDREHKVLEQFVLADPLRDGEDLQANPLIHVEIDHVLQHQDMRLVAQLGEQLGDIEQHSARAAALQGRRDEQDAAG